MLSVFLFAFYEQRFQSPQMPLHPQIGLRESKYPMWLMSARVQGVRIPYGRLHLLQSAGLHLYGVGYGL